MSTVYMVIGMSDNDKWYDSLGSQFPIIEDTYEDENRTTVHVRTVSDMTQTALHYVTQEKSLVIHSTRLSALGRKDLISRIKNTCNTCELICVLLATPPSSFINHNRSAFTTFLQTIQIPQWSEGWTTMVIIYPENIDQNKYLLDKTVCDNSHVTIRSHNKTKTLEQLTTEMCQLSTRYHVVFGDKTLSTMLIYMSVLPYCYNIDTLSCPAAYTSLFYSRAIGMTTDEIFSTAGILQGLAYYPAYSLYHSPEMNTIIQALAEIQKAVWEK